MQQRMKEINEQAKSCPCGSNHHPIEIDAIYIEPRAMDRIASYLLERNYKRVLLVADSITLEAAGAKLQESLLAADLEIKRCIIPPDHQGDVVADERSIVHLMLEVSPDVTDILIAVGSGTVHDIVRFAAYKMNKPFLSVPTAPSVDGFNSKGAPVIIKGEKITIPASAPAAIFADLDVLVKAPAAMVAAGFVDMLGKYTSLFDWKFSHAIAEEPYCPLVASITEKALQDCVAQVDEIAARSEEGIRLLITALIESGLAMLVFGQSHPASGAEHHLSHYWEMEYLRLGNKQLLHGAKVGAACAEIAALYDRVIKEEQLPKAAADAAQDEASSGKLLYIQDKWGEIQGWQREIPATDQLKAWLQTVGGPTVPSELGVTQELVGRSLREAHEVRKNRYTLLRAHNEFLL